MKIDPKFDPSLRHEAPRTYTDVTGKPIPAGPVGKDLQTQGDRLREMKRLQRVKALPGEPGWRPTFTMKEIAQLRQVPKKYRRRELAQLRALALEREKAALGPMLEYQIPVTWSNELAKAIITKCHQHLAELDGPLELKSFMKNAEIEGAKVPDGYMQIESDVELRHLAVQVLIDTFAANLVVTQPGDVKATPLEQINAQQGEA